MKRALVVETFKPRKRVRNEQASKPTNAQIEQQQ